MTAPKIAVGDGALGFGRRFVMCSPRPPSSAAGGTRSATCSPRCRSRSTAKKALAEIYAAEDKTHARAAAKAFAAEFGTKWPKATAKITDDLDVLLAFYDFPAEHWIHLRTTNPIESTFATTSGCASGSRKAPDRGRPESRWHSSWIESVQPAGAA